MMKVIVNNHDVIKLIVDYLQSQDLYLSAECTQEEAGVSSDEHHGALLPLKEFVLQGKWYATRRYLQPFIDLYKESFPTKRLLQVLFRQQFCEVCFGNRNEDSTASLQDITQEIEETFTGEEYDETIHTVQTYWQSLCQRSSTVVSIQQMARKEAFRDVTALISPFLPASNNETPGNRLTSLLVKGLLYDRCTEYCYGRATGTMTSEAQRGAITLHERMANSSAVDANLYYWLASLKNNELFVKEHHCEDLQVLRSNSNTFQGDIAEEEQNRATTAADPGNRKRGSLNPWGVTFSEATTFCDDGLSDGATQPTRGRKSEVWGDIPGRAGVDQKADIKQAQEEKPPSSNGRLSSNMNDTNSVTQQRVSSNPLPKEDDIPTLKATAPTPDRIPQAETHVSPALHSEPTNPPNNPSTRPSVRDSYSSYVAERNEARENYNKFMEEIRHKEERTSALRRNLMAKTMHEQGGGPGNATPPSGTPVLNPPLAYDPHVPPQPNILSNAARPSTASPSVDVNSPQVLGQKGNRNSPRKTPPPIPPAGAQMLPATKDPPQDSPNRRHGLKYSYYPMEKTEDLAAIRAVAFHPRGGAFAVGSNSHVLKLCSVSNRATVPQSRQTKSRGPDWMQMITKKSQVHQGSIYALAWNEQGNILASCSNDKLIKIFNYDHDRQVLQGPQYHLSHHDGVIRDVTFMTGFKNGSVLASGGASDFVVYTYACDVDTVVHQLTGHSDQILSLYSWSTGLLASSSQDRSVRLWDLRSSRCVSVLGFGPSSEQHAIPTSVCVDATGDRMAVGRDDNVVSLYDLKAGKAMSEFTVHGEEVRSVRFNPAMSNLLLSSSYDGSAVVTDVSALNENVDLSALSFKCSHHRDKVIQSRWHPSGMSFATTSADQSCVLWGARDL